MQMKANHLRWFGVFSILAIVIISYVDRINVSVLITNQHFLNYLGIAGDRVAQGELMTLFLIGYGIAAFFLSPIYETFLGVRKGLLISIFIWGFFTIISPFAGTVTLFVLFRFILGASEGPLFSLKTMYVKDEFQVNERGKPNAITSMGVFIGGSGDVSFTAGFSLLIGTQLVTAICGILFYFTKVNKQMNHSTY
jgi:MFS family permease